MRLVELIILAHYRSCVRPDFNAAVQHLHHNCLPALHVYAKTLPVLPKQHKHIAMCTHAGSVTIAFQRQPVQELTHAYICASRSHHTNTHTHVQTRKPHTFMHTHRQYFTSSRSRQQQ